MYAKISEGVVTQIQPNIDEGFIEVPDHVICGQLYDGNNFTNPEVVPSIEELAEAVRSALQAEIDSQARSLGFSSGNSLMLYAGFENHYRALAQVFASWEASVWVEADAYKDEVLAGTKTMLTGPQAVELMPDYPD